MRSVAVVQDQLDEGYPGRSGYLEARFNRNEGRGNFRTAVG